MRQASTPSFWWCVSAALERSTHCEPHNNTQRPRVQMRPLCSGTRSTPRRPPPDGVCVWRANLEKRCAHDRVGLVDKPRLWVLCVIAHGCTSPHLLHTRDRHCKTRLSHTLLSVHSLCLTQFSSCQAVEARQKACAVPVPLRVRVNLREETNSGASNIQESRQRTTKRTCGSADLLLDTTSGHLFLTESGVASFTTVRLTHTHTQTQEYKWIDGNTRYTRPMTRTATHSDIHRQDRKQFVAQFVPVMVSFTTLTSTTSLA